MTEAIDMTGLRFGKLLVVSRCGSRSRAAKWLCLCECGRQSEVIGANLRKGMSRSCGCMSGKRTAREPVAKTRTYIVWVGIKQRCLNENSTAYRRYGGRGIKVCARWMQFENFLEDMGERPPGLSIERVDNNGDYEPSNCIWADSKTQAANRQVSVKWTHNGETLTIAEWGRRSGLHPSLLRSRVVECGWTIAEALSIGAGRPGANRPRPARRSVQPQSDVPAKQSLVRGHRQST